MPACDQRLLTTTSASLARELGLEHVGIDRSVTRASTPRDAGPDCLTFIRGGDGEGPTCDCTIIAAPGWAGRERHSGCTFLLAEQPRHAFAKALATMAPAVEAGVSPLAAVAPTAQVDPSARVDPFAVIEDAAVVGARTVVRAHAVVRAGVVVGDDCEIGEHVVLGNDGLTVPVGSDGEPIPMRHLGGLRIGARTRIGPGTTIGRGTLGDAIIGCACVIGPQVNVGHNGIVGDCCILTGGCRLAGGVSLGMGAWIGTGAVIHHKRSIGAWAVVGGGAVVTEDVAERQTVAAVGAMPVREAARIRLSARGSNRG